MEIMILLKSKVECVNLCLGMLLYKWFENCYEKTNDCNRKAKTQFEICLRTRELLHPQHVFNSDHFMKLYLLVHPNQNKKEQGKDYAQGAEEGSFL